jgi:hypothetical protein
MFSLIGAMFYALRLHRRRLLFANVIPAHIAVQIFGVSAAFLSILKIFLLFSVTNTQEFRAEERRSEEVALWYVGKHLAEKYEGKTVTVVMAPPKFADQNQAIRLKGLKEGLNSKMTIKEEVVVFNKRKGRRPKRAYTSDNLDDVLVDNLDTDVVLLLIGLPKSYFEMEFWGAKKLPAVYTYRGYSMEIDLDLKEELIDGYITMNPKERFSGSETNKAEKTDAFFNKYFIFAQPDNIDKLLHRHPALFFSPKSLAK